MGCCKSRRRWLEPDIDYDPDFREKRKVHGSTYRCPGGHVMEELITEKAGYLRCDVCGRAQDLGRRMQGCWDCDYHVCSSCEKKFQDADWYASWFAFWHGKQPKEVQKDEGADIDSPNASTVAPEVPTPRCPGKHTLYQYFVPEDPPLQCDVCGKRLAPYKRIWGCSSCDFDIGPCCQQKFQDPDFMQSWQTFWCLQGSLEEEVEPLAPTDLHGESSGHPGVDSPVPAAVPKTEVAQVELPTQEVAPEGPKVAPEGPKAVAPEGPKVTRPKPIRLHIPQEELQKTQQESSKGMVLGGKNEVVAPALMKAVLKKESSVEKSQTSRDPAVLKFARKGATVFTPEETGEPRGSKEGHTSVVPEEAQEGEKKSKKKKKDDKEKSEKSEKKEKKHKKEGKEGRDGDEEGAEKRATRREKKSRREMQSRREQ